ncbi:MAG: amidohydrolase family protein [Planctomycetota bacterium]|jgi:cytosine/adenosine deaminase-related metal-dependent hydrolase
MDLDTVCTSAEDFGFPGCYRVPAFVNAHTHLELTFHKGHADREPEHFPAWVDQLMASAKGSTEETFKQSYRDGLAQSLALGSTTIVDHCRRASYLLPALQGYPGRVVTAYEFSGFEDAKAEEHFQQVLEIRAQYPKEIQAISPVAPHSISGPLYEIAIRYAREKGLLLCGHLAETEEELQFLRDGSGPFVHFMVQFKPRDMSDFTVPKCTPVEWMDRLGGLGPNSLAAHANFLSDRDIELLARSVTSVVHCPGSYKFFGHTSFRLRDLITAGVNVCLGTDSLASNDTLSVLEAMRDLRKDHAWLSDEAVFRMGTVNGHKALNGGREPESLPDDVCVFPWTEGKPPERITKDRILQDLLSGTSDPVAVFIGGKRVYESAFGG